MKDKQELKDEQKFYLKTCKEFEEQRDLQDDKSQGWHTCDMIAHICSEYAEEIRHKLCEMGCTD
ncbi:hypothetical protein G4998_02695 [[Eubacterium] rectale]|uniref:hypothetical protein n=1 Tax=Agathobacter rectalis TaxID=39491 RepID=UPI00156D5D57|nr:hypothetical protein [Agathobacter rectalis]NSI71833.1 hypothetical protein [Agathobacter rectalis]NSI77893.1 hypothetical protein [Agathobacter rectalis]NSI91479.1 hypothetical protein [Agathobacter rectalis]NSJ07658.1 hypothetical protein [Agathobacter rectalis]